ncbi:MAG TPA: serine hydrolase [Pyrinomonadaceae bacterium]|nr:serine hydrolase [Pyrinomonadaceae bacterium]
MSKRLSSLVLMGSLLCAANLNSSAALAQGSLKGQLAGKAEAAAGATVQEDEKLARILGKLQARLDEARLSSKLPGATVGFVLPDGRFGSVSTGVSDLGTGRPLKPSDRLLAGSIGKTFVAAVALLLVEEGKLNLDEKIERLLGNEKWFHHLPNAKEITLRMLLNHSSGIQNHVDSSGFINSMFKSPGRDIRYEELVAYVLNKKPLFAPGKGHHYSDTNYILAGLLVEKATGKTLYDEITERILKPLKLERTIPANSRTLPEVATGYFQNRPMIVGGKFIVNPQWEWAGGGFASTAEDLARWARALYAGDLLQKKSLDEMLNSTTIGEGEGYGLGVEIVRSRWGKSYGHDGEFPGYLSDMRYYTTHNLVVAVQVNADEEPGVNRFMAGAVDDFAGVIIREISGRALGEADQSSLRKLTESWLQLIDAGRFTESWEELSDKLRAKFARDKWQSALQPFIGKVGKIKTRRFKSADYSDPETETVTVEFESSFTKFPAASEVVTLERGKDGRWRVAGYSIH